MSTKTPPPEEMAFVATHNYMLLNVSGSQQHPVVEGTEHVHIDGILMTRLDATCIFLNGYNRHTVVQNSDSEWLGENAIAAWGYTTGMEEVLPGYCPDARNGDQPRFTTIRNNLVHEIGICKNQSSMWFQAQTCQTKIENKYVIQI